MGLGHLGRSKVFLCVGASPGYGVPIEAPESLVPPAKRALWRFTSSLLILHVIHGSLVEDRFRRLTIGSAARLVTRTNRAEHITQFWNNFMLVAREAACHLQDPAAGLPLSQQLSP